MTRRTIHPGWALLVILFWVTSGCGLKPDQAFPDEVQRLDGGDASDDGGTSEDSDSAAEDDNETALRDASDGEAEDRVDASFDEAEAGLGDGADGSADQSVESGVDDAPLDAQPDTMDVSPTCVSDCPKLGNFRCGGESEGGVLRQLQVCSLANGCLQWLDTAVCGQDEACCNGSCRSFESALACYVPPGFDFYVDAKRGFAVADAGASDIGTPQRPFRTVTQAVQVASAAGLGKKIYVAPGNYDANLGELFPIVVRGVSLFGAGSSLVTLHGSGDFVRTAAPDTFTGTYSVTLVIGDDASNTTISGMTILGASAAPLATYFGMFCDRGSGADTSATTGVTSLESVVVGPGFHHAIMVVGSTVPKTSACNFRMTKSTVTGALYGVIAVGCPRGGSGVLVSAQIGDATNGNTFSWMGSPYNDGAGVLFQGCVTNSSFRNNTFTNSAGAITIDQSVDPGRGIHPFIFEKNVFSNLTASGLSIVGNAISAELNDNTFTNTSSNKVNGEWPAIALLLGGSEGYLPVKKARRNTFVGNDIAVYSSSSDVVAFGPAGLFDFGTKDDPGQNVFRCNSRPSLGAGGDVYFQLPGTGAAPFEGNVWDHYPPTQSTSGTENGADAVFTMTPQPTLNVTGGRADISPCPSGRIPGP